MKAYRDRAEKLFGITAPEAIIPDSAHAAFIKGTHYFGIKLVIAPTGDDRRLDINAVAKLLNKNTVMVVASAPSFPHGVIDPIEELGQLLENHPQVGLHVDGCLGGFILPWLQKLGHVKTNFDFAVPRVTSISADLHKYAFAPKGASVILWKDSTYRKYQYFSYCDWSGGLYCSPAIQGSRAGGPMAGAWAVLVNLGEQGFLQHATAYWNAFSRVLAG
jgi:sphinganine-1-phosphate aldolase